MSKVLEGKAAQVADMLFERGAVKFGAFRLKPHETHPDAPLSPIYLNIRSEGHKDGTLRPEDFDLIADLLAEIIERNNCEFQYLAGIPVAGEPIAAALVEKLRETHPQLDQLHLGKEEREGKRRITHPAETLLFTPTTNGIILVDDLITQADTKLEAIRVCEDCRLEVEAVVVLVDREQGGLEQIEAAGHDLISALDLSELLAHYVETGKIEQSKAEEIGAYQAAH